MDANKIREIRIIRENPRFRRYPEYKQSGVDWIGEIPKDWKVLKAKHVGSSNPSKNNPKTTCLKDRPVVFLPMERVQTDGTIDQELRLPYSQLKNGYTYFEEGDILIAKVTPCFENGKIVHIKNLETSVGFGSTEFIVIRPDLQKVFPPFLYYIFRSDPLRSIGKHFMTSAIGLKRVPTEFVENFQIPIPVYQEQTQIAKFLDRKIKQIDELIRVKERRIELLQEQRTALINQTVTKGLNPNVEMKPSGVEWIGEIPAHWNLSMLKYAARLVYGDTLTSENREDEGVVPVYGSNGIIDTHSSANTLSPAIIVGRKGSLGKIQYSDVPCFVIDTAYYIDRRTSHANLRWLYYVLQALKLEKFRNSVLPGLNREVAEGQYIPLITVEEQAQIAACLDHKTQQIDDLTVAEQRKIELLKEYRQSLISEAVTGKIDARNEV